MKKIVISFLCILVLLGTLIFSISFSPRTSSATTASEQAQIQALLVLITQLQQQLSTLLSQQASCLVLTQNLYIGLNDASTGGQVSKLQKFLKAQGDYTYPTITGFFGAATQSALQKFQARVGLVSGGTPATNGFGVAGPATRAKIQSLSCGGPTTPALPLAPALPVPLPGGVTGSCSPSIATIIQGQSVTWTASVSGGIGSYTYLWSGTNNLSGSASSVTKIYNSEGNKNATVKINGVSIPCSSAVTVNENPALNYNISCSASATQISVGGSVTYSTTVSGGTPPYTYSWDGSDGLSGSASSVTKTYSTSGLKSASVTINNIDEKDCPDVQVGSSITGSLSWPPTDVASRKIYAYSWPDIPPGQYTNVFTFYWVGAGGGNVSNPVDGAITKTIDFIANQPEGHKVVRFRNVEDWLFSYKDLSTNTWKDMCLNPTTGEPQIMHLDLTGTSAANLPHVQPSPGVPAGIVDAPMPCLWWDEGKNFTQNWLTAFFLGIKNAGKKIDVIVNDDEPVAGQGGWNLAGIQTKCVADRANCPVSWCEAIVADLRFPPEDFPFPNDFVQKVCTSTGQNFNDFLENIRVYDDWLFDRMAGYMDEAIFDVATNYFPDVKMSSYGFLHWNDNYNVPYGGSWDIYKTGNGAHPGTHQGPFAYGDLNASASQMNSAGLPNYTPNAFNSFRLYANWAKSAALSNSAHLHTWVTDKAYPGSQVASSDLYQEMLMHVALANNDQFIYWTGDGSNGAPLLNSVLTEINLMLGYENVEMIDNDISDWYTDYMYTGANVGDHNVWRFTPKLSGGQTLSNIIVNSGSSDGTSSVVLSAGGDTITFENAIIYTPANPVSQQGLWIIQNASAPNPIVAYAQTDSSHLYANAWTAVSGGFQAFVDSLINSIGWVVNLVSSLF